MAKQKSPEQYQVEFVGSVIKNFLNPELNEEIIPVGTLSPKQVIEVYHRDYVARLTEALGETLEACWAVLGDDLFFAFARNYIEAYPSHYPDLGQFADHFPKFLENHKILEDFPFLIDLANFEIHFWRLFHAPKEADAKVVLMDPESLASQPLLFLRALKLFNWSYKIFDLWKERKVGLSGLNVENFDGPQNVLMFKNEDRVQSVLLSDPQRLILAKLLEGASLNLALDQVVISEDELSRLFQILQTNRLLKGTR